METHIYQISALGSSPGIYIGNHLGNPSPDAFATLNWIPAEGLQLTMWCYEPTDADTWLAFCLDCYPRYRYKGYLTIEFHSSGANRCTFGAGNINRNDITALGIPPLKVQVSRATRDGGTCWMGEVLIPKKILRKLYGFSENFHPGHKMRGNFYSYSENPDHPTWCAWAPTSQPDLHKSEFFGLLEIV